MEGVAARSAVLTPNAAVGPVARTLVRLLFGITILLSIVLVKWGVAGFPVRSMTALLLLFVIAVYRFQVVVASLQEAKYVIAVIGICAVLGVASSLLNANDMPLVGRQLLEIHAQALVGTIIGISVRQICGSAIIVKALAITIGLSVVVAALQFLNVSAAWDARQALGSLQEENVVTQWMYLLRQRAMGLSYSPVHLGTQICLLFAAFYAYRSGSAGAGWFSRVDAKILFAVPLLAAASIVSGNRSPLLGLLLFTLLYLWFVRRRHAIALIAVGLILFPLVQEVPGALQGFGLRVASTDDGSALGRTVLQVYGLMLLADRPFGYGLTFDSTEHWTNFWSSLHGFANAEAITTHALHNYYLIMVNKYGLPILLVGLAIARRLHDRRHLLLGFIPYLIHVFYHNDGPLQADFLIWYVIPIYLGVIRSGPQPLIETSRPMAATPLRQPVRA